MAHKNICAIVNDRVKAKEPKNKAELNREIIKVLKELITDKLLYKKLMQSIPARMQAVIALEGRQVRKEDYEGRREEYTNLPRW